MTMLVTGLGVLLVLTAGMAEQQVEPKIPEGLIPLERLPSTTKAKSLKAPPPALYLLVDLKTIESTDQVINADGDRLSIGDDGSLALISFFGPGPSLAAMLRTTDVGYLAQESQLASRGAGGGSSLTPIKELPLTLMEGLRLMTFFDDGSVQVEKNHANHVVAVNQRVLVRTSSDAHRSATSIFMTYGFRKRSLLRGQSEEGPHQVR